MPMSAYALPALLFATLFTGAALYITLVEHPARLPLGEAPMLTQWQASYRRALPIQSTLAILAVVAGLAAGWSTSDWRWIAGGVAMLANWPFTLAVLLPVNRRLMATLPVQAGASSHLLLLRWGRLHDVRSGLGVVAMLLYLSAFLQVLPTA